jgi:hypothetical protein
MRKLINKIIEFFNQDVDVLPKFVEHYEPKLKKLDIQDDNIKPFEITVDDIKRNEFDRKNKQKEEFYQRYKELSDEELERKLTETIKKEALNDYRYNKYLYLSDSFVEDYPTYKYIEDNINNIQERLKKAGYTLKFYQLPPERGSAKSVTIYWS